MEQEYYQEVVIGLMPSSDNPLDFHLEMHLVLVIILIYLCAGGKIK